MSESLIDRLRKPSGIGEPMDHQAMVEAAAALERVAVLEEDAARWRALMASQRIRIMGSAGFHWQPGGAIGVRPGDYMHLGVELWNKHEATHPSAEFPQDDCREMLTFYVDRIRAALGEKANG